MPPGLVHPCVRLHFASNLRTRATLHDYHLEGDEVNADSELTKEARRTVWRLNSGRSSGSLQAQGCNGGARQVLDMGLTVRVLDRQGGGGAIAGQGELLSAEFGVEVTARELKDRI